MLTGTAAAIRCKHDNVQDDEIFRLAKDLENRCNFCDGPLNGLLHAQDMAVTS